MIGIKTSLLSVAARRLIVSPLLNVELLTNGGFDTDSDWTKGASVTISDGACHWGGVNATASQPIAFVEGATYRTTFVLSSRTAGSIRVLFTGGSSVLGTSRSGVGTYQEDLVALAGNDSFHLQGFSSPILSVSSVSMMRIA